METQSMRVVRITAAAHRLATNAARREHLPLYLYLERVLVSLPEPQRDHQEPSPRRVSAHLTLLAEAAVLAGAKRYGTPFSTYLDFALAAIHRARHYVEVLDRVYWLADRAAHRLGQTRNTFADDTMELVLPPGMLVLDMGEDEAIRQHRQLRYKCTKRRRKRHHRYVKLSPAAYTQALTAAARRGLPLPTYVSSALSHRALTLLEVHA